MNRILLAVCVSAVMTTGANGQDAPEKTVEAAYQFINQAREFNLGIKVLNSSGNGNMGYNHYRWKVWNIKYKHYDFDQDHNLDPYPVTEFQQTEKCRTSVKFTIDDPKLVVEPYVKGDAQLVERVFIPPETNQFIDWTKVPPVKAQDSSADIYVGDKIFQVRSDLRDRVISAFEFIRASCDPTANSAF